MRIGVGGGIGPLRGGVSNRGVGVGFGPISVGESNRDMEGCATFIFGAVLLGLVAVGPYFLGKWVAGLFGAGPQSPARFITGWVFEGIYLAVIALVVTALFTQAVARVLVSALGLWLSTFVTGHHVSLAPEQRGFWETVIMLLFGGFFLSFLMLRAVIDVEDAIPFALVCLVTNIVSLYLLSFLFRPSDDADWGLTIDGFGWALLASALIAVFQAFASSLVAAIQE
ncbi:phage holin family protein [Isoptericola sp. b515]|uniref:phage holin family protein n=1 Tax=Isoptericola sp. b515 TaxID=3064652 RepID=UPI00271303F9|nr:phage holin family protein [Isoptericola sp. b515]MDO8147504.1 phage holin family protein [Isoptericola sp. b515]